MMLFGDLKNGGWATITIVDDKICLVSKAKESKVPLLTTDSTVATLDAEIDGI